jgi:hypothetical protein
VGFLLSGVLTDYKESKKIPGAIAAALETLSLEIQGKASRLTTQRHLLTAL